MSQANIREKVGQPATEIEKQLFSTYAICGVFNGETGINETPSEFQPSPGKVSTTNRWFSYSQPIPFDFQPLLSYMARHRIVMPQRLYQGFRQRAAVPLVFDSNTKFILSIVIR